MGRGTYAGRRYLSPDSIARMEIPKSTDAARLGFDAGAGLGVLAEPAKRKVRVYGHDGGIDGFNAAYRYAPDANAGYVMMVNRIAPEVFEAREEIMAYLLRGVPDPESRNVPVAKEQEDKWSGAYVSISPRIQKLTVFEDLVAMQTVSFDGGVATINGETQTHLGGGRFAIAGSAAPSYLIHDAGGQTRLEYVGGVARKLAGWEVAARFAFAGGFALSLLGSIAYALVWIPSAAWGRLRARGGVTVRLLPALGPLTVALAIFALMSILVRDDIEELAMPTVWGWILAASTVAIPAIAAASALTLVLRRASVPLAPWIAGWLCVAVTAVAAAHVFAYGAVGFRIWS